jgi:hypothetical protein
VAPSEVGVLVLTHIVLYGEISVEDLQEVAVQKVLEYTNLHRLRHLVIEILAKGVLETLVLIIKPPVFEVSFYFLYPFKLYRVVIIEFH